MDGLGGGHLEQAAARLGDAVLGLAGIEFDARGCGRGGGPGLPEGVRATARAAMIEARLIERRVGGTRWLVGGWTAPLPFWIAQPLAPLSSDARAEGALRSLAAALAAGPLAAALEADPLLALAASSPTLRPLVAPLRRIAPTRLPVLLVGETGTGKEVVARALHAASGRRGRFVAENCAALPETLLEAELFGAERGAFTGATRARRGLVREADGGTLLLDEVAELAPALQAKLLRVLQEGEVRPLGADRPQRVDLRIVAALQQAPGAPGTLRADLFHRLAGIVVALPALRHRGDDLAPLAATLLARIARDGCGAGRRLAGGGLARLAAQPFPGNVRELDNLLRRAAALSATATIDPALLAPHDEAAWRSPANLEVEAIRGALVGSGGNRTRAAARLGWTRQKLYRRLAALGLASGSSGSASQA